MKNIFVLIAAIGAAVLGFLVLEKAEIKRQRVPAQYAYVNEQDPYGVSNVRKINGLRMEINNELKMMESLGELIEIVESAAITQESRASVKEFADDGEPSSNNGNIVIDGIYLDDNDVIFAIEVWQRLIWALIESVISKEATICFQEAKYSDFYETLAKQQNKVETTRRSITIDRRYSRVERTACLKFLEDAQRTLEAEERLTTGINNEKPDGKTISLYNVDGFVVV